MNIISYFAISGPHALLAINLEHSPFFITAAITVIVMIRQRYFAL